MIVYAAAAAASYPRLYIRVARARTIIRGASAAHRTSSHIRLAGAARAAL